MDSDTKLHIQSLSTMIGVLLPLIVLALGSVIMLFFDSDTKRKEIKQLQQQVQELQKEVHIVHADEIRKLQQHVKELQPREPLQVRAGPRD